MPQEKTIKLVIIRHGKTQYNIEKKFCGWTDVGLAPEGEQEATRAGEILRKNGFAFDAAYVSVLKRTIATAQIVLENMGQKVPIVQHWRLNERCYGALQGLTHQEMKDKYGEEQVQLWRRSFDVRPPQLEKSDPRHPSHDKKYSALKEGEIPSGESLRDTLGRVFPYWEDVLAPALQSGKKVLVVASGNSIRALVKHLDSIPDDEIVKVEIKTGTPLVYELDASLKPIRHYYLE